MVIPTMSSHSGSAARFGAVIQPPEGVVITHPNRDKPVVQATRATVVLGGLSARRSTART